MNELGTIDLRKTITSFEIPVIFISGNLDWVTPYPMVQTFEATINAPFKKMVMIDQAGHSPMMDNPEQFCQEVIAALAEIE